MDNTNETSLVLRQDVLALGKVELQTFGAAEAKKLLDEGYIDATKLLVDSRKYMELLTAFNKAVKEAAIDELTALGTAKGVGNAKVVLGSTGDRLDYAADPIYIELKEALDQRVDLLKMAKKQSTALYDGEGIEIPKVPIKTFGEIVPKISL